MTITGSHHQLVNNRSRRVTPLVAKKSDLPALRGSSNYLSDFLNGPFSIQMFSTRRWTCEIYLMDL